MAAPLNCRQGDLAMVREPGLSMKCLIDGGDVLLVAAGTPVTCARPTTYFGQPSWVLEAPIKVRLRCTCGMSSAGLVEAINDSMLRPIRDPGADAVDEIVERVGVAPKVFALEDSNV